MITKNYINAFMIGIVSFVYGAIYYLNAPRQVAELVSLSLYKPYVYRQLVPILARLLMSLDMDAGLAIVLIMTLAGVGFYLSLQRLVFLVYKGGSEMVVFLMVLAGMVMFHLHRMPYDLMTAFLFATAFMLLIENRYQEYALLFIVICINRETSFLLVIFYFATLLTHKIYLERIWLFVYQVFVWLGIRLIITTVFSGNGGEDTWIEPFENVVRFINNPLTTILHLSATVVLLYLVAKNWEAKPRFFKIAFVTFAPLLTVMYFVFGQAFETRVFWEIFPIVAVLSYPTIVEFSELFIRNPKTLLERA